MKPIETKKVDSIIKPAFKYIIVLTIFGIIAFAVYKILAAFGYVISAEDIKVYAVPSAAAVSAVFAFISNNDSNRKQNAISYITSNRTDWMEKVRNITAE